MPLHGVRETRDLENAFAGHQSSSRLMERAGLAIAQLALAIAPHARRIWIACGPGNNGGDGYEAACHLANWGKQPVVTRLAPDKSLPQDAAASFARAVETGVQFADRPPDEPDLCIDALFGIGQLSPWTERCVRWIETMNAARVPVLAVDLPSGLDADSGSCTPIHVKAGHTLSLLTLKPGLFMGSGRDACGNIWFNDLGICAIDNACAKLGAAPEAIPRRHNSHKGSFGDVAVWGGERGMEGAAILAARAALRAGAGRVYVALLGGETPTHDMLYPELMLRTPSELAQSNMPVVAGCGGGHAIREWLPTLLRNAQQLVLDADALNAVSTTPALQELLLERPPHSTVITPHPLEAARLMGMQSSDVQAQRLQVAQTLADRFGCVVALKGSGTVIAAPNQCPTVNPTGNGRLASAGTGDVLAGLIGARLAQGQSAFDATCAAVYRHGELADKWPIGMGFSAQNLVNAVS